MYIQEVKVISKHHLNRLQVCFIGFETTFNRRGKRVQRKVSKTRHLRFENGGWWGTSLDNAFSMRNYSDWVMPNTAGLKAA